jgi:hypothetical protein
MTAVEWYNSKIKYKMTAVEWFAKELYEKFEMKGDGKVFDGLLKLANAKFKKQIISAHCDGQNIEDTGGVLDAEPYYNKTFK